jgi:SAM-dependent methyltransferase
MTEAPPACRGCGRVLRHLVVDLGAMPLANRFLNEADLARPEPRYPLRVRFCDGCYLVQADESVRPERIFSDYPYFSSYSTQWLDHARDYSAMAIDRFSLGPSSRVVEVASNDGYLLRNFVGAGIPCLGIEPAENVAAVARAAGIPTRALFLGAATAGTIRAEFGAADLVIANNVLAHTPAIDDLAAGMAALLKPQGGVLTVEFPHLMRLIDQTQFDTIYHEHFSYLSLAAVERLFARHRLRVFDVERLPTHGGSLRIFAERTEAPMRAEAERLRALRAEEQAAGVCDPRYYAEFGSRVGKTIASVRRFFAEAARDGRTVAGYGAAAKGNTLLNACGATRSDIAYAADKNPHKQGRYLPGTHIPIFAPGRIAETRPDYVFILPWNLRDEIARELYYVRDWGGRFAVAIPALEIFAP